MARNFDGTDDSVDFGSDASIDDFNVRTVSFWILVSTGASEVDYIVSKNSGATGWGVEYNTFNATSSRFGLFQGFSVASGEWFAPQVTVPTHVVVVYDRTSSANDPVVYFNGVSQTITETQTPSGSAVADAAGALHMGELGGGANDFTGVISHFCYHNAAFSAADVNRAMWWGRPFGGLKAYHPFLTSKVANEGSATADGTVSGSTMAAMVVPAMRPGSAMMGMGVGW